MRNLARKRLLPRLSTTRVREQRSLYRGGLWGKYQWSLTNNLRIMYGSYGLLTSVLGLRWVPSTNDNWAVIWWFVRDGSWLAIACLVSNSVGRQSLTILPVGCVNLFWWLECISGVFPFDFPSKLKSPIGSYISLGDNNIHLALFLAWLLTSKSFRVNLCNGLKINDGSFHGRSTGWG